MSHSKPNQLASTDLLSRHANQMEAIKHPYKSQTGGKPIGRHLARKVRAYLPRGIKLYSRMRSVI